MAQNRIDLHYFLILLDRKIIRAYHEAGVIRYDCDTAVWTQVR